MFQWSSQNKIVKMKQMQFTLKGRQHLNGEEALALARTRHIDSDYMRGQRQQLVLEAIAQKHYHLIPLIRSVVY